MSRTLLQSEDPNIYKQELETALGGVVVARLRTLATTFLNNTITELIVPDNSTVLIRTCVLARQVSGNDGTAGDSGGWTLHGTFKNIGGSLFEVGTQTLVSDHCDTNWSCAYEISNNRLYVQGVMPTLGADRNVVWNTYSYLFTLSGD